MPELIKKKIEEEMNDREGKWEAVIIPVPEIDT